MRRTTLFLSLALAVSVAINLLIAGIVVGNRAAERRLPPAAQGSQLGAAAGFQLDRSLGVVPEALKSAIREELTADRGRMRDQVRGVRAARLAVVDTLSRRPFDAAAARAALGKLRDVTALAQFRLHEAVVDAMEKAESAGTLPPPRTFERAGGTGRP